MSKKINKGPVSFKDFESAIHDGIHVAHKDYMGLSGFGVRHAPEYYLTTKIAGELQKLNLYVDLEASVKNVLVKAKAVAPGPIPSKIRGNGRFDFVAHSKNENPRFIGEVKHPVSGLIKIKSDVQRISSVLNRGDKNTLQSGVVAIYAHNFSKGKAVKKLDDFLGKLKEQCLGVMGVGAGRVHVGHRLLDQEDDYASASVCVLILPPKGSLKKSPSES